MTQYGFQDGMAAQVDLSQPHPAFSEWTRKQTYDRVTAMFLDCCNVCEIALELSREFQSAVTPQLVEDVRFEAWSAAEGQPHEIRLKWLYRFSRPTLNNLVKEYMFLESRTQFLSAKQELAEEVEALLRQTSLDRLCIAMNDALGRNNVGLDVLERLGGYARTARRVNNLIKPFAQKEGIAAQEAVLKVAAAIGCGVGPQGQDTSATRAKVAQLVNQNERLISDDDVSFLEEYARIGSRDTLPGGLNAGNVDVDVEIATGSVMDRVMDENGEHLTYLELRQLAQMMRSSCLMTEKELKCVLGYAERHRKDIETMRELGVTMETPEAVQELQGKVLKTLEKIAGAHLSLTDHRSFFTREEFSRAAALLVPPRELQGILDKLNSLAGPAEIKSFISSLDGQKKKFQFPASRYEESRFGFMEDAGS